jgi:hypothetical protein
MWVYWWAKWHWSDFLRALQFPLPNLTPQTAPYSLITVLSIWYNLYTWASINVQLKKITVDKQQGVRPKIWVWVKSLWQWILKKVLSRVWVITDVVWIGNWFYWTLLYTTCNYQHLWSHHWFTHSAVYHSKHQVFSVCCVFTSRCLLTVSNGGWYLCGNNKVNREVLFLNKLLILMFTETHLLIMNHLQLKKICCVFDFFINVPFLSRNEGKFATFQNLPELRNVSETPWCFINFKYSLIWDHNIVTYLWFHD